MSPQVRKIVTWTVTVLLAFLMLAAGIGKFNAKPDGESINYFLAFSDASWLPVLIASLEIIAGLVILFVTKLRTLAALGIMVIMSGALYSHIQLDGDFSNSGGAVMGFVLAGLSIYFWNNYYKAFPPQT